MTLIPEPREVRSLRRFAPSPAERDHQRRAEAEWDSRLYVAPVGTELGEAGWQEVAVSNVELITEPAVTIAFDASPIWGARPVSITWSLSDPWAAMAIVGNEFVIRMLAGDRNKKSRKIRKAAQRRRRALIRQQALAAQPSYRGHR